MPRAFTKDERQRVRTGLLGAGRDAASQGGFRRITVASLCRAAGISKGAFYQFFPSKEVLFMELCLEAEAEVRQTLDDLVEDPSLEPPDRLRAVLELLFDEVTRHPMLSAMADPEELPWLMRVLPADKLETAAEDDDRYFTEVAQRLIACGAIRQGADLVAFTGVPIAALGMAQHRQMIGEERYPRLLRLLVDGLVGELGPRPARRG